MDIFYGIYHERGVLRAILSKLFLYIVWALYYIQIVVEVTTNMAEYSSSCQF